MRFRVGEPGELGRGVASLRLSRGGLGASGAGGLRRWWCWGLDDSSSDSFTFEGIPPAPAGKEKLEELFDIDANGILTVTATHKATGMTRGMTLDTKTSGRLTTDEINSLVQKAELMKIFDEADENRIRSRCRLEDLGNQIKLALQKKDAEKCYSSLHGVA